MNLKDLFTSGRFADINEIIVERRSWYQRKSSHLYRSVLNNLPSVENIKLDFNGNTVAIGEKEEIESSRYSLVCRHARDLIPWKKGPFNLFGVEIDAEWRSDFKWNRIKEYLPSLQGKIILDIGCNNGYFMFKMAAQNPAFVLGIDPVMHFQTQFLFLQNFARIPCLSHQLLGVEHLPLMEDAFDVVFSMGIVYHHRDPIKQLRDIKACLKKEGTLVLETMGVPGEESHAFFPKDRYAGMKNTWFIPTLPCLINWVKRCGFKDIEVISSLPLSIKEQRLTDWCPSPKKTLMDFLNKDDHTRTVEGFPAPWRFCLTAKK
ncbi:MAG: tRNA 5-methoxyuridine(34)/uridine 5-oxyacetic acid(34) synthase CmoB [Halobacteriovoraceae bacterium]|nr:tRNA 5-methoxyuridine(34)/uridine 5-oxyacetic acid(34) synthase CmoB [Halobacteriovoraceae bacterium]